MVRLKIKGAACGVYKVYTVVTTSQGITALALAVIPLGSYTIGGYKVLCTYSTSHLDYGLTVVYLIVRSRRKFKPL